MRRRSLLSLLLAAALLPATIPAAAAVGADAAECQAAQTIAADGPVLSPATDSAAATEPAPASRPGILDDTPEGAAAQLRERAEQTRGLSTYVTLLVVLLLSGFGLPIPEEVPLLLAGYLARHGAANLGGLIATGLVGVLVADFILFLVVRRWRSHIFRLRWVRAMIQPRHIASARRLFHNHGLKIVIVARWLPALRSAVVLTASLTGVKLWRFMVVDTIAACITVPTATVLGYALADHIDRVIATFWHAEHVLVWSLLGFAVAGIVLRLLWLRRARRQSELVRPLPPRNGQIDSDEPAKTQLETDHALPAIPQPPRQVPERRKDKATNGS